MADNTKPIPPVPNKADILEDQKDSRKTSVTWIRWFIQLRDKINLINASIANLANFSGSGFIASDGDGNFTGRTIEGTTGNIAVVNGDGAAGNPKVNLIDTAVTPGTYANTNLTVDEFGRITDATNGSASGAPLTTKGDLFGYDTGDARIPVGADGEVLTADSSVPAGVAYKPAGTPTLPVTTKGDLLGYSTLPARVPVGTNGQALLSDSSSPLGVIWGANGYPEGTSFPVSPSIDDKFYRTDLNYLCYYDGTYWLTTQVFTSDVLGQQSIYPVSANTSISYSPIPISYQLYIERVLVSCYVSSTNSGSSYWTIEAAWLNSSNTATLIGSINTSAGPANGWTSGVATIGSSISTTAVTFRTAITKTGSPGSCYPTLSIFYRLIIT